MLLLGYGGDAVAADAVEKKRGKEKNRHDWTGTW